MQELHLGAKSPSEPNNTELNNFDFKSRPSSSDTSISWDKKVVQVETFNAKTFSEQTSDNVSKDGKKCSSNEHLTRPTFGISHETQALIVTDGFSFNDKSFTMSDNHHTPFDEQIINIGETNSFSAKVYAPKGIKVQEFLFGVPIIGHGHLAELGVEIWFDHQGEIIDIKAVQQSKVIDHKNRYQLTYLNDGFEIVGDSLNPMNTLLIPSDEKGEGLIQITDLKV